MIGEYGAIVYSAEDRVARITLNRPEKRNAMDLHLPRDLVAALRRAERDDSVSIVLLDGAGPMFCSGYDMSPGAYMSPDEGYVSPLFDSWTDRFARNTVQDWLVIWDLYDAMEFRAAMMAATSWHFVSAKIRPNAGEFRKIAEEQGLKAAIEWRDGPFREIGG